MACLVQDALTAKLPLVVVRSNDPFYDTAIIRHMTTVAKRLNPSGYVVQDEKKLVGLLIGDGNSSVHGNKVVCFVGDTANIGWKEIYQACLEKGSTCVVILRDDTDFKLGYYAGILNPPEEMFFESLKPFCEDIMIPSLQKALQGLSLSNADAVLRLTKDRLNGGEITPAAIRETRKAFVGGVRGLQIVEVNQPYYKPDPEVLDWLKINSEPFKKAAMQTLIPRGILFEGVAGTGKSAGSKYIAQRLNVQLVKVSLDSMLSKWSGDAEHNLDVALATLDQMAPCVALFDEVEKVVSTNDDDGSMKRLLSKLLWWLQERTSRVLVIMTTNNLKALPQELYRAPRVDETITLNGLSAVSDDLSMFYEGLKVPYLANLLNVPTEAELSQRVQPLRYRVVDGKKERDPNGPLLAQAEVTGEFIKIVKQYNYA